MRRLRHAVRLRSGAGRAVIHWRRLVCGAVLTARRPGDLAAAVLARRPAARPPGHRLRAPRCRDLCGVRRDRRSTRRRGRRPAQLMDERTHDRLHGALDRYRAPPTHARVYADLHEHVLALARAGLLQVVDEPINKDTEMHPLVRWQFRGGIAEPERKAFLFTQATDTK